MERWEKRTLAVLGSILLGAFLLEMGVRIFLPPLPRDLVVKSKHPDPVFHHRAPFMDEDLPERGKTPRVVFVGDSFTYGFGLRNRHLDAIPPLVAKAASAQGAPIDAVNMGMVSYSPTIEYLVIRDLAIPAKPDAIVLLVDESDVQDDAIYEDMTEWEGSTLMGVNPFQFRIAKPLFFAATFRWFGYLWHSREGRSPQEFLDGVFEPVGGKVARRRRCSEVPIICRRNRYTYSHKNPRDFEEDYERTLGWLGKIAELADDAGVRLLVVTYPYPASLDLTPHAKRWRGAWKHPSGVELESRLTPRVAEWSAEEGISFFDFTEVVVREADIASLYPGSHSHFNVKGNRLFAQALLPKIRELLSANPTSERSRVR